MTRKKSKSDNKKVSASKNCDCINWGYTIKGNKLDKPIEKITNPLDCHRECQKDKSCEGWVLNLDKSICSLKPSADESVMKKIPADNTRLNKMAGNRKCDNSCEATVCYNGGKCQLDNQDPICICEPGFSGKFCKDKETVTPTPPVNQPAPKVETECSAENRCEDEHVCVNKKCTPVASLDSCYEVDVAYNGGNVQTVDGVESPASCQQKCRDEPKCSFFTWTEYTHVCNLKGAVGEMTRKKSKSDNKKVSASKNCDCINWGYTIKGNKLDKPIEKITNPLDCHRECQKDKSCEGWVLNLDKKICSLKPSADESVMKK